MTFRDRSLDDLPLAAYTTGVEPGDVDMEPEIDAPAEDHAAAAAAAIAAADADAAAAAGERLLGARDIGPFEDEPQPAPTVSPGGDRPPLVELLRNPRAHVRDPRLALGGVVGIGVVMLGLSLLGGGGPGPATGANPSPTAPTAATSTALPAGDASVEVTGTKVVESYQLLGRSGVGPAVKSRISSTWGDTVGNTLALGGPVSAGTRTTDATFVLTWTVLVEGVPVTFTSKAGECTVGMAVSPRSVSGSFVCKKLTSDDGELTVGARGTYRT